MSQGQENEDSLRCDLCSESCAETQANLLACTYKHCEGGMYHQECLEKFLKSNRLEKVGGPAATATQARTRAHAYIHCVRVPAASPCYRPLWMMMELLPSHPIQMAHPPSALAEPQDRLQVPSRLRERHEISGAVPWQGEASGDSMHFFSSRLQVLCPAPPPATRARARA